MKAWFLHLKVVVFEGSLARKLRFHIFNFQFLREVSHESFVFTSWSLQFNCDKVAAMSLCSFKRFLVPFIFHLEFLLKSFKNRTFCGFGAETQFWSRVWPGEASVLPTLWWCPRWGPSKRRRLKPKPRPRPEPKDVFRRRRPRGAVWRTRGAKRHKEAGGTEAGRAKAEPKESLKKRGEEGKEPAKNSRNRRLGSTVASCIAALITTGTTILTSIAVPATTATATATTITTTTIITTKWLLLSDYY